MSPPRKDLAKGQSASPAPPLSPNAVKRMLTYQIEREMARQALTRGRMAALMGTSRAALNRLLDPDNESVTLQTLLRAAEVLNKRLEITLNDKNDNQGD